MDPATIQQGLLENRAARSWVHVGLLCVLVLWMTLALSSDSRPATHNAWRMTPGEVARLVWTKVEAGHPQVLRRRRWGLNSTKAERTARRLAALGMRDALGDLAERGREVVPGVSYLAPGGRLPGSVITFRRSRSSRAAAISFAMTLTKTVTVWKEVVTRY